MPSCVGEVPFMCVAGRVVVVLELVTLRGMISVKGCEWGGAVGVRGVVSVVCVVVCTVCVSVCG